MLLNRKNCVCLLCKDIKMHCLLLLRLAMTPHEKCPKELIFPLYCQLAPLPHNQSPVFSTLVGDTMIYLSFDSLIWKFPNATLFSNSHFLVIKSCPFCLVNLLNRPCSSISMVSALLKALAFSHLFYYESILPSQSPVHLNSFQLYSQSDLCTMRV